MKALLFYLLSITLLIAQEKYPELFSQLGTPLYKADKAFAKLPLSQSYSFDVTHYHQSQTKALELYNEGDKSAYFKALRSLSKEHDKIISIVKQELSNAIHNRDHNYFISLSNAGLDILYTQESFKRLNYDYYLKNKDKGKSEYLEKRIDSEKGYEKRYGIDISTQVHSATVSRSHHKIHKRLILLSTSWCGACKRAKKSLKEHGIRYVEYDAEKSSKGKNLMKRYKGTGYPTFIIGDESVSGYSLSWIRERL